MWVEMWEWTLVKRSSKHPTLYCTRVGKNMKASKCSLVLSHSVCSRMGTFHHHWNHSSSSSSSTPSLPYIRCQHLLSDTYCGRRSKMQPDGSIYQWCDMHKKKKRKRKIIHSRINCSVIDPKNVQHCIGDELDPNWRLLLTLINFWMWHPCLPGTDRCGIDSGKRPCESDNGIRGSLCWLGFC